MTAYVRVESVSKVFALAEHGGGPVSLRKALRAGKRETVHREVRALQDVSFEIREGERVGIIGRNGAGKTTMLSLIAGITDPTSGRIEIGGDVHAMLTIGAVLREEATGRENIYLDGAIHGRSRDQIDGHVEEVIAFAELAEFIDRPVRTYSSGMKARLAFAMGAFIDPDVFILDETLAVGDSFFSVKALRRMKEITARGRIVILVSHALAAIVEMCDRCLWFEQGRLKMDGPSKAVTDAYQAAVAQADEAELAAKFGTRAPAARSGPGTIASLTLVQGGVAVAATARAFRPLEIVVEGHIVQPTSAIDLDLDLDLVITRVDGRRILHRLLSEHVADRLAAGPFRVSIGFDPLLLGADLYRIDVALKDAGGLFAGAHRVIDIIDEEGQFGGTPLLYLSPQISVRPLGGAA